jgi:hypothetical protein
MKKISVVNAAFGVDIHTTSQNCNGALSCRFSPPLSYLKSVMAPNILCFDETYFLAHFVNY